MAETSSKKSWIEITPEARIAELQSHIHYLDRRIERQFDVIESLVRLLERETP